MNMEQSALVAAPAEAGNWIADSLEPWFSLPGQKMPVGGLLPRTYEAYLRIAHPIEAFGGSDRWSELGQRAGIDVSGATSWDQLGSDLGLKGALLDGHLPQSVAVVLADHLGKGSSQEVVFGLWEGWGRPVPLKIRRPHFRRSQRISAATSADEDSLWVTSPTLSLPGRTYKLVQGSVDRIRTVPNFYASCPSPTIWWAANREWFVVTEVDFVSTYLGGPMDLVSALASDSRLEAWPVTAQTEAVS